MIAITKEEKKAISRFFPNVHVARTMKQKSKRGHYFMTEHRGAMQMLRKLRGETNSESKDKEYV